MVGPSGLPVLSNASLSPLSLTNLADWKSYGLSLSPDQTTHSGSKCFFLCVVYIMINYCRGWGCGPLRVLSVEKRTELD